MIGCAYIGGVMLNDRKVYAWAGVCRCLLVVVKMLYVVPAHRFVAQNTCSQFAGEPIIIAAKKG